MMAHSLANDGDLSYTPPGPRARVARVSGRADGRISQEGPRGPSCSSTGNSRSSTCDTSPIPTPPACTTASPTCTRWSRRRLSGCWAPTGSCCCTRCCWPRSSLRRIVPRGTLANDRRPARGRGLLPGHGHTRLRRLDDAGAVQPDDGDAGVFLLALQGSRARDVAAWPAMAAHRLVRCRGALCCWRIASFSKPPNAALIGPMVLLAWSRRRWSWGLLLGVVFTSLLAALFIGNLAITGDLNFQGGERRTYYTGFPFMDATMGFDVGLGRATNEAAHRRPVRSRIVSGRAWDGTSSTSSSDGIRACCRISFPGLLALALFLWPRTQRLGWQWLVFAAVVGETLLQLVWLPYTYYGGPGVLGSRYYMNIYGLQLFLLPALSSVALALVPWFVGCRVHREDHAEPVLLLVPSARARQGRPAALAADRIDAGQRPADQHAGRPRAAVLWPGPALSDLLPRRQRVSARRRLVLDPRPLPRRPAVQDARAGDANSGSRSKTARYRPTCGSPWMAGSWRRRSARTSRRSCRCRLGRAPRMWGTRVWVVTIAVDSGHVPLFDVGGEDARYLGVKVSPQLLP